jgi:hypothetical protein
MEKRSRSAKFALSLALAVALFYYFLSKANLHDVISRIGNLRPGFFALAIASSLATLPLRGWRWKFLLRPVGEVTFGASLSATCIGFASSTVLPARAGEIIRPVVLSRRTSVPFSGALASVAFERLLDLAAVLAFVVAFVVRSRGLPAGADAVRHPELVLRLAALSAAILVAFAGASVAAVLRRAQMVRLVEIVSSRLPAGAKTRIRGAAASFIDGLSIVRDWRSFAASVVLSVAVWMAVYLQIFFLLRAFEVPLGFWAAVIICLFTLVGMLIPTPGAIGGFQAMCSYALTFFYSVSIDTATAFALVYWAVAFIPVTAIGFSLFAAGPRKSKESLADLAAAGAEE